MIRFDCDLARGDFHLRAAFEAGSGITALFGPSGSGKSTVIQLVAGLARPARGAIVLDGRTVLSTSDRVFVPPHRRRVGLVFQDAHLFPHLSVRHNLGFGRFFTPRAERRIAFAPVVEMLGIGHLLERRPDTLSGGERQRVAIGRALLTSPRLLLMDEPLASLDQARKLEILPFIETLADEFRTPILYVSHSVEEVTRLARTVVRLAQGRVIAVGRPDAVLAPALADQAGRFAAVSVLEAGPGRYVEGYKVTELTHPAGQIVVPWRVPPHRKQRLLVHATDVTLARGDSDGLSVRTALRGRIAAIETDDGPFALVRVRLVGGEMLTVFLTRLAADALALAIDDEVRALVKAVTLDETEASGGR